MTAKQAKELSIKNLTDALSENYFAVIAAIKSSAQKGRMSISLDVNISKQLREKLQEDGYVVKTDSFRNEYRTDIIWK